MALCNRIKVNWFKLIIGLAVCVLFFAGFMSGLSLFMTKLLAGDDEIKEELTHMNLQPYNTHFYNEIKVEYLNLDQYRNIPLLSPDEPLLDKIVRTRTLQVGYDPEALPFSFFNRKGVLVGYDIDFIYDLAESLRCKKIEFYKIANFSEFQKAIAAGKSLDIGVGGYMYLGRPEENVITSDPFMKYTAAIVIPTALKEKYTDFVSVYFSKELTLGVRLGWDQELANRKYTRSKKFLNSYSEFYVDHKADALLVSAEIASALSIIYHGYWVYYYNPPDLKIFYAYLLPYKNNSLTFRNMVNSTINTLKWDGTAEKRYKYWIMGQSKTKTKGTWSVLGWLKSYNYFIDEPKKKELQN